MSVSKRARLRAHIDAFEDSIRTTTDYYTLFVEVINATRQGSGLMYEDLLEVLKEMGFGEYNQEEADIINKNIETYLL